MSARVIRNRGGYPSLREKYYAPLDSGVAILFEELSYFTGKPHRPGEQPVGPISRFQC